MIFTLLTVAMSFYHRALRKTRPPRQVVHEYRGVFTTQSAVDQNFANVFTFDLSNVSLQSPETESSESSESVESTSEDTVGSIIARRALSAQIASLMQINHVSCTLPQTSEESDSESDENVSLAIFSK